MGRLALEKIGLETAGHCSCQQCLSGPGWAIQKYTLGRLDAHSEEELWILQGKLDDLAQLADLVVETADTAKADLTRVFQGHVVYKRIHFSWQCPHNGESGHVERDSHLSLSAQSVDGTCYTTHALFQLGLLQARPAADNISWPRRCLDDDCIGQHASFEARK